MRESRVRSVADPFTHRVLNYLRMLTTENTEG